MMAHLILCARRNTNYTHKLKQQVEEEKNKNLELQGELEDYRKIQGIKQETEDAGVIKKFKKSITSAAAKKRNTKATKPTAQGDVTDMGGDLSMCSLDKKRQKNVARHDARMAEITAAYKQSCEENGWETSPPKKRKKHQTKHTRKKDNVGVSKRKTRTCRAKVDGTYADEASFHDDSGTEHGCDVSVADEQPLQECNATSADEKQHQECDDSFDDEKPFFADEKPPQVRNVIAAYYQDYGEGCTYDHRKTSSYNEEGNSLYCNRGFVLFNVACCVCRADFVTKVEGENQIKPSNKKPAYVCRGSTSAFGCSHSMCCSCYRKALLSEN